MMKPEKTYKREVAGLLLTMYLGLLITGVWIPEAAAASESLKYEVFIFASGAFALDCFAKQVKK